MSIFEKQLESAKQDFNAGKIAECLEKLQSIQENISDKEIKKELGLTLAEGNGLLREQSLGLRKIEVEAIQSYRSRLYDRFEQLFEYTKSLKAIKPVYADKNIAQLAELLQEKIESKLDYTEEDVKNIDQIKKLIWENSFKIFNERLEKSPNNKSTESKLLFDRIIHTDDPQNKLHPVDIDTINKIRVSEKHEKSHRILVVSALAVSLLECENLDLVRANLLVDFLTDFEEGVWESALLGLFIGLLKFDTKLKSPAYSKFANRLKKLKDIEQVQRALFNIDLFCRLKLYDLQYISENATKIIEKASKMPLLYNDFLLKEIEENFFNDKASEDEEGIYEFAYRMTAENKVFSSPHAWFLPFQEDNEVLKKTIEFSQHEVDFLQLHAVLSKTIFIPDFIKYLICIDLENKAKEEIETTIELINYSNSILNSQFKKLGEEEIIGLNIAKAFYNYYGFYRVYDKNKNYEFFNKEINMPQMNLTHFLLDESGFTKMEGFRLLESGQTLEGVQKLEDYIHKSSSIDVRVLDILVYYHYNNKAYDQVDSIGSRVNLLSADNNLAITQAISLYNLNQYAQAEQLFKQISVSKLTDENHLSYTYYLGGCYFLQGKYNELLSFWQDFEPALVDDNFWIYYHKGIAAFRVGDYESSLKNHKICHVIDTNHVENLLRIGMAAASGPDMGGAGHYYQKALDLEPDNVFCLREYGIYKMEIGDLENARDLLQRAFSLAPNDSITRLRLLKVNRLLGK
jgi:hypothetical protein